MESNNRNLGTDMDETMPDAEHTTAEAQETELPVDADTPQAEIAPDEAAQNEQGQAEVAPEESEEPEDAAVASADADDAPGDEADDAEPSGEAAFEPVDAVGDEIVGDEALADDAVGDEALADEALADEAVGDEAVDDAVVDVDDEDEAAAAFVDDADEAVEAVEHDADEDDADEAADEDEVDEAEAEEAPRIRKGQIVEGTVVETSPTEVLIELEPDLVGVVASRELERMDREALEALQVGSTVTAYVLKAKGSNGQPVLSLARAEEENNWRLAEEHYENKEVYFSKVAGYNKGGLIVRFGKVRGFVPASQVSRERQRRASGESPEERWGSMVGDDIAVKVVEIDRSRNRLILSERAAAREWRERQKSRLLEDLEVGETRTGRVISIADFGAFVDLGGADGLVHLTELSWQHVTHPRDVVEVGQEVEVQVISIDRKRKRIGLSMKRQEEDPWQDVVRQYDVGQLVQATVTKLTKFGAFARLVDSPEIEGLIHISELADYRVNHPREVVLVGDVLTLRIVKIDPQQRRLGLSLRQVDSAKFMDQDWQAIVDEFEDEEEPEPPTIGDMVNYQTDDEEAVSDDDLPADEESFDEESFDDVSNDDVSNDDVSDDDAAFEDGLFDEGEADDD